MQSIGIDGCYLRWFVNFLSDRWQYVAYGSAISSLLPRPILSGVVHGSVVGPCVFMVFINDQCTVIKHAKPILFADGLKVADNMSTLEDGDLMQEDITAIAAWSLENKLPISLLKCAVLHYENKNIRRRYTLCKQVICSVNSCPDLGLLRSNSLSYDDHIRAAALRATRLVGIVMKDFKTRKPEFLP